MNANDTDGAKIFGIHCDVTDGTAPRQFEDVETGTGTSVDTTTPPTGHNRWLKQVPTAGSSFNYIGDNDNTVGAAHVGWPLQGPTRKFAVCANHFKINGTPTATTNWAFGASWRNMTTTSTYRRVLQVRTDLKFNLLDAALNIIDTSSSAFSATATYDLVIVVDTDAAGTVRTTVRVDGTAISWAGSGTTYVDDNTDSGSQVADYIGVSIGSGSPADNGISTLLAEIGILDGSAWLGDYPQGFTAGKLAPDADSADAAYLEWTAAVPPPTLQHYQNVSDEVYASGYSVSSATANQQEVFGHAATDTTSVPAANTILALKSWGNLRSSSGIPDTANFKHLIRDNGGAYTQYSTFDEMTSARASSVTLRYRPGTTTLWTAADVDAVEAGWDKVGAGGTTYRVRQSWLTVLSISNPASNFGLVPPRRAIHNFLVTR